ncbi:MAG: thiamine pyrophosphate-binding protein [Desulfobacterales bacterium]|jgi:thiamine pyrophosphate-dependent acetolactate synthase large subunit-like protein
MDINSGDIIGRVLRKRGVKFLFTLCGGHISPILVGAKKEGIRVVDVRDEVNAVFAADAVGRLTGVPGVAAVTAGPGLTNSLTALKNADLVMLAGMPCDFRLGYGRSFGSGSRLISINRSKDDLKLNCRPDSVCRSLTPSSAIVSR